MSLNISFQSILACKVSDEKSTDRLMGALLRITNCFSLAAFKILSLSLIFGILIIMCLGVFLFGFILFGTLSFLDLYIYFLHPVSEVFHHHFCKIGFPWLFLQIPFPLFSLWYPHMTMLFCLTLSQRFLILSLFYWILFFFTLLIVFCFHIFQISDLILYFIYSTFNSLYIFISVNVCVISDWFFFMFSSFAFIFSIYFLSSH